MKKKPNYLEILVILTLSLSQIIFAAPRVFVFTDINIDAGDPDDRQSLIHLLWYANELEVEGIVPDRWNAKGYEACELAFDAYALDFERFEFSKQRYPQPALLRKRIARDLAHAEKLFNEAVAKDNAPLWVLVWGSLENAGRLISKHVQAASRLRLITTGTHLMKEEHRKYLPPGWEVKERPCEQPNWNGAGRKELYENQDLKNLWWLEINSTYEGMFTGQEPTMMFDKLQSYGALGAHMAQVVQNQPWARYFRVGDTPSVLFVIDPRKNLDDPTKPSWAGQYVQPFPDDRPHYYTDACGSIPWDYANPCNTWDRHEEVWNYAKSTLEKERPAMYEALLAKLSEVYRMPRKDQ